MKKEFITIFYILSLSLVLLSFKTKQKNERTKINIDLSLVLPAHAEEQENLFSMLKKTNPNFIFFRSVLTSKSKKILFAVSRYENSESDKLDNVLRLKCEICGPVLRGDDPKKYPQCKRHGIK